MVRFSLVYIFKISPNILLMWFSLNKWRNSLTHAFLSIWMFQSWILNLTYKKRKKIFRVKTKKMLHCGFFEVHSGVVVWYCHKQTYGLTKMPTHWPTLCIPLYTLTWHKLNLVELIIKRNSSMEISRINSRASEFKENLGLSFAGPHFYNPSSSKWFLSRQGPNTFKW